MAFGLSTSFTMAWNLRATGRPCCLSARYAASAAAPSPGDNKRRGHVRHEREQVAKWRTDSAASGESEGEEEDKDKREGRRR